MVELELGMLELGMAEVSATVSALAAKIPGTDLQNEGENEGDYC